MYDVCVCTVLTSQIQALRAPTAVLDPRGGCVLTKSPRSCELWLFVGNLLASVLVLREFSKNRVPFKVLFIRVPYYFLEPKKGP